MPVSFFDVVILGIVEGITEFLPVSSTGHLILASHALGLAESDFLKTFEIAIQSGAILSVLVLYRKTLAADLEIWKRILSAFLPTALIGLLSYTTVKSLLGSEAVVVWALFLGGAFLIGFELWNKNKRSSTAGKKDITTRDAVLIGFFQAISLIPGVSRSGATIVGGLILGLEKKIIVEFSFLLAIPTMLAATLYDLYKNAGAFSQSDVSLFCVGFVVSFFAALVAVKTFLAFIESHSFIAFGVYRILAAILFFLVFL